MQRRVEEPDGHRQAVHGLEDLHEVGPLGHAERLEGRLLLGRGGGQDHPPHDRQAVLGQEHVLGAAQADALGAVAGGRWRRPARCRRWPAPPRWPGPDLVGPTQDGLELGRRSRPRTAGPGPSTTVPLVPSTEIQSPSLTTVSPDA